MPSLTLGGVIDEIDAELERGGGIDADIKKGIQYAVRFLRRKRLHINERRHANIKLIAGQTWYATFSGEDPADTDQQDDLSEIPFSFEEPAYGGAITELISVDHAFHIDTSGRKTIIEPIRFDRFNELRLSPQTQLIPDGYCIYAQNVGFYPTPSTSGGYVFFMGQFYPYYPENSVDTTIYFDQAIDAVKALAKWWLATEKFHDTAEAQRLEARIAAEIRQLKAETADRSATGFIESSWW